MILLSPSGPFASSPLHAQAQPWFVRLFDRSLTWLVLVWVLLFAWVLFSAEGRRMARSFAQRRRIAANARRAGRTRG